MDDVQAKTAFMTLGNDVRFTIFRLLAAYGSVGLSAGVVAEQVGLKPTAISFHLSNMTAAGVLVQRRMRRNLFYSLNENLVGEMAAFLLNALSPLPPRAIAAPRPTTPTDACGSE